MAPRLLLLALAAFPAANEAVAVDAAARLGQNPIRKVVTLLQAMQKKVTEEGEKEEALYERFACYCKKGAANLQASIGGAETKLPTVEAEIKSSQDQKVQLEAELKQAQVDRDQAKQAIKEATAIREKEAAAFAAYKTEADANIGAIHKAVAALEKGAGGFLQTGAAQVLANLIRGKQDIMEQDRQEVLSFLAGKAGYAPSSGEVTGILKQLGDEFEQALADATATENSAISSFQGLVAAKKREIEALGASIESKIERIGELGVLIVQLKNDLGETAEALAADKEFLANLETSCASKKGEWEERQKTRSDELAALSETIKLLNDDDALDLFGKTLPSASASFVQLTASRKSMQARALEQILTAQKSFGQDSVLLDRIVLALHGKQVGFEKVVALIDGMVATLKKEQQDDEHKKEYCAGQFDVADDQKKVLERAVSDAETAIAKSEEAIARLAEEIDALESGIKALDKSVAEATEQRKKEHDDYTELIASNSAAKELLAMAKNRLNKFYNPKMYKEAPKQELSAQDRIVANMGASLVQVHAHLQRKGSKDAPPPAPETFGEYAKKSEETSGVMAMIDLLVKDLDKEITEAEAEEKNDQAQYEKLLKDSAGKRTADSKALTQKQASKADIEAQKGAQTSAKESSARELQATLQYIQALHGECDWLLQYFETRKEARTGEIESLGKAKAVLSGASFSLLQTRAGRGFLRRA